MTLEGVAQRAHDPGRRGGTRDPASPVQGFTPELRAELLAKKWREMGGTADDLVAASLLDRTLLASIAAVGDVLDSEWTLAVRLLRAEVQSGPPCQEAG